MTDKNDKAEIVKRLLAAGNRPEKAKLYADAYIEYAIAQKNIEENGSICIHPRTLSPVANPYLPIRDKAFFRIEALHKAGVKASSLW